MSHCRGQAHRLEQSAGGSSVSPHPDWYGFQKDITWIDAKDTIDQSPGTAMGDEEEKQKDQAHVYSLWNKFKKTENF